MNDDSTPKTAREDQSPVLPAETTDEPENKCNRSGRKQLTRKTLCLLLATALATLAALLFYVLSEHRTPDFNELLTQARLAKLPKAIENLKVETRPAMVDDRVMRNHHWLFVRFEAEPDDIDRFANSSPSIDKSNLRPLSTATYGSENPSWWLIDPSASGWIYGFHKQEGILTGCVVVDNDSNAVLIFIWFGTDLQNRNAQFWLDDLKDDAEDVVEDLYRKVQDLL